MKIPMKPPSYESLLRELESEAGSSKLVDILNALKTDAAVEDEYLHWDKLRYKKPPKDFSINKWWFAIKMARKSLYKFLPFTDNEGKPFLLATFDLILKKLHNIDCDTGNTIQTPNPLFNSQLRDTYLIYSLIEESITSSQLEGASTSRRVAKEMLQTQRKPRNLSEKMIFNNYHAMQFVREIKDEKLTPEIILELHATLTKDTLENSKEVGCLRTTDDIHIWDHQDQILHTPPKAKELKSRLKKLCHFANETIEQHKFFIHPVIKAILLHFILAYDHPFVDGNGRTARALFYWSMANQGYWLMEFISISHVLKKAPSQYARAFLHTETDENDVTYFVIHQLDAIITAINTLHEYVRKQTLEIQQTEQLINSKKFLNNKLNYRQIELIKHALKNPNEHYRIEIYRQAHNITYDTARTDLLKLEKLKLLKKQKIGKAFIFIASAELKKLLLFS